MSKLFFCSMLLQILFSLFVSSNLVKVKKNCTIHSRHNNNTVHYNFSFFLFNFHFHFFSLLPFTCATGKLKFFLFSCSLYLWDICYETELIGEEIIWLLCAWCGLPAERKFQLNGGWRMIFLWVKNSGDRSFESVSNKRL